MSPAPPVDETTPDLGDLGDAAAAPRGSPAAAPDRFADAPPLARAARRLDVALGRAEQALLVALLFVIVTVASATALATLPWADETIRYGVFAMAMLGGAYAAHHQRLMSMDLVSKLLAPRARAMLRLAIAGFTIAMAAVLVYGGLRIVDLQREIHQLGIIPTTVPAWFIPIGMTLIGVHVLLGALIELSYLGAGRVAPEAEQGGAP